MVFYSLVVAMLTNCKSPKIELRDYLQKTDKVRIKCTGKQAKDALIYDKDTIDKFVKVFSMKEANGMPTTHIELSQIEYFSKGKYLFTIYYTDKGLHYLFNNEHHMVKLPITTDSFFKSLCL